MQNQKIKEAVKHHQLLKKIRGRENEKRISRA